MARKFFVPAAPGLGVNVNPPAGTLALTGQVPSVRFPPSIPTGLAANALTNTVIGLSWNPSTDTGGPGLQDYRIYRNGVVVGTTGPQSPLVQYSDTGLTPSTTYTYNVTARDLNGVESAQSTAAAAQTQGGAAPLTLVHNQAFTLTGPAGSFGTKTRAAPLKYDNPSLGTVGTVSPLWDALQGIQPTTAGGNFNMQLQNVGFAPTGFNPGAPDPFQTKVYAGCHLVLNNPTAGNEVLIAGKWTAPTTPYPIWARAAQRFDANWTADPYADNNLKVLYYSATDTVLPTDGNFFYTNWQPNTSTLTNAISGITVANPGVVTIALPQSQNPLTAGHAVALIGMPAGWTSLEATIVNVTAVSGLFNQWHGTMALDTSALPPYPAPGTVTNIVKGTSTVVSFTHPSSTNPCVVGTILMFQNVGGMTQVNLPLNINMIMTVTQVSTVSPNNYTATINQNTTGSDGRTFGNYTSGGTIYFGLGTTPNTSSIVSNQLGCDAPSQPSGGPFMWENPGANSHDTRFWNNILYPTNPNNGWIRSEWEMGVSSVTGASGGGYFNTFDNLVRAQNYVGKTENADPSASRNFAIGAYSRDRGANNFRYFGGPIVLDVGETGQLTVPRVIFGDQSTLAACTKTEYAPAVSWSDTSISATFYQGNFALGQTVYAYVYTGPNGTPTTPVVSGTVQAAVTFDFFISTTGSDSNAGTLASPWAITAINSKRATYAGKKVGVIAGTYDMLAAIGGTYNGKGFDFATPAYSIAGGSSTNPTYIASCNASGIYTPRVAKLNGNMTDANNTAPSGSPPPLIGATSPVMGSGYITLDGLEIFNANDRLVSFGVNGLSAPNANNFIIKNCYLHAINSTYSGGGNSAAITIYSCTGALSQNNYVTDINNTSNRESAIEYWVCQSSKMLQNTVRMSHAQSDALYVKNAHQQNIEIAYNYLDLSAAPSTAGNGITGWDLQGSSAATSMFHHNIVLGAKAFDSDIAGVNMAACTENQQFYNNTVKFTLSNGGTGGLLTFGAAGTAKFWNNIFADTVGGGHGFINVNTSQMALTDYNLFAGAVSLGLTTDGSTSSSNAAFSSIASWAPQLPAGCVGKDSHSLVGTPPTFSGGAHGNALDWQLATGSVGHGQGSLDGTSTGAACDMGAWGAGGVSASPPPQIGSVINGVYD